MSNFNNQTGSMLLTTVYILLMITLLCAAYWQMLRFNTRMLEAKQGHLKAYYAARAGLADALSEIKQGHTWGSLNMDPQWVFDTGTTFYKSTSATPPLTHFDSPTTLSVTVVGNPLIETINITSLAKVYSSQQEYITILKAQAIRSSPDNEIHILGVQEIQ